MSIAYRVEREENRIRVEVGGALNDLNFVATVRGIAAERSIRPGMDLLVDLRDATASTVSRSGIVRSAAILCEPAVAFVGGRVALVAIDRRQLGDLPCVLLGLLPKEIRVFSTIEHALDWLGADAETTRAATPVSPDATPRTTKPSCS